VPLTVRTLTEELGLGLEHGGDRSTAPVRWVHSTELTDPTPWLSGGELILTTGLQLPDAASQSGFVKLLAEHDVAGIGFGTGFGHDAVPPALITATRRFDMPLFEIPYEMPFIAVTEAAFSRIVNEEYELLQRGTAVHKRLEQLVLQERGLDELVSALAATIASTILVLDPRGETVASSAGDVAVPVDALDPLRAQLRERSAALGRSGEVTDGDEFEPDEPGLEGRSLVLPISTRGRGTPQAWLVAVGHEGELSAFEHLILQQATTVVALELMRQRAMRDTERRLAGDMLAEAIGGSLSARDLAERLAPFGIGDRAAVLAFSCPDPAAGERDLETLLSEAGTHALVATRDELLCAIVDGSDADLDFMELANRLRVALDKAHGPVRAAVSRVAKTVEVRQSFNEARCALEAVQFANGSAPDVASYRDLGAFQLLLSLQDDEALRLYCESVLAPLRDSGDEYGDELLRSVEAFIECNGQWERAARQLYCHRHTLRYRIKRVEELTGRDLSNARDRIEIWLALRARDLVK
jgi:purine catabolism regulator